MDRRKRIILGVVGAIVLTPVALVAAAWIWWDLHFYDSKILDFHPSDFSASADGNFFYSIQNDLKFSSSIDTKAPTLLRGSITEFCVSPDGTDIAVVADGKLQVVSSKDAKVILVTPVDTIYRDRKPIGREFFRDDNFQWSRDGKYLFLIKDKYYESKGSQLYSNYGELWKYSLETGALQAVLRPFPAYNYFFGNHKCIYFSVPTPEGNLQLKYFDGSNLPIDIADPAVAEINPDGLSRTFVEHPFYSFSDVEYESSVLSAKGIVTHTAGNRIEVIRIHGEDVLQFSEGEGLKGAYYCVELQTSRFLPGDRYLLLDVPYCGNYKGQLLVDTVTGQYKTLPKDTRVLRVFNTETYPHYRINGEGIEVARSSNRGK